MGVSAQLGRTNCVAWIASTHPTPARLCTCPLSNPPPPRFKWTSVSAGVLSLDTLGTRWPAAIAVYRDAPSLAVLRQPVAISSRCPYNATAGTADYAPSCVGVVVPSAGVTLVVQVGGGVGVGGKPARSFFALPAASHVSVLCAV